MRQYEGPSVVNLRHDGLTEEPSRQCQKANKKEDVRRCSACLSTYYCSKVHGCSYRHLHPNVTNT